VKNGHLMIGGVDSVELASKYQTPLVFMMLKKLEVKSTYLRIVLKRAV
jgi:hypothetical protein